ncbi:AGAMOUS-like 105 [Arabidopsis thaliana]|uniref:AGAMOUS-like 105 n=1 Tax=Arabidopsis thaliana TaxID=3702 RepID=B3H4N9_ARATH|nr:AGAMOUS-like 105 [Arabidopsis thaliana]AED94184.1 AGAMOUS-like 105 [Arabidopsis thaliana]|eukprot:NP_680360.2 AGAMOUS-like 105 [Arabidopsis thaliana]
MRDPDIVQNTRSLILLRVLTHEKLIQSHRYFFVGWIHKNLSRFRRKIRRRFLHCDFSGFGFFPRRFLFGFVLEKMDHLQESFRGSELCILCDIEACVIYYGPDGELKTWPKEREKVEDIALRYSQLNEALRRKKSVTLYDFLNKKKDKTNLEKKAMITDNDDLKTCLKNVNVLKSPIADHYFNDQISQLIQSLEPHVSKVQERIRFVESQKHKETKLDHQSLASIYSLNQSLNPSQFTLFLYNHGDNTMSQIPNMFMNNNNFQHSFVSNTQDYSALQESVNNNYGLMPNVLCGYDQNLFTSDITNNNLLIDNSMYL